jgi:hypothetical protein
MLGHERHRLATFRVKFALAFPSIRAFAFGYFSLLLAPLDCDSCVTLARHGAHLLEPTVRRHGAFHCANTDGIRAASARFESPIASDHAPIRECEYRLAVLVGTEHAVHCGVFSGDPAGNLRLVSVGTALNLFAGGRSLYVPRRAACIFLVFRDTRAIRFQYFCVLRPSLGRVVAVIHSSVVRFAHFVIPGSRNAAQFCVGAIVVISCHVNTSVKKEPLRTGTPSRSEP